MGNTRFKLSDMMPTAWFHRHRGRNKPSHSTPKAQQRESQELDPQKPPPTFIRNRASCYIPSDSPLHPKAMDTLFPPDPPRKPCQKPGKKPISPRLFSPHSAHSKGVTFGLPAILTKPPKREEIKMKKQQQEQAKLNYNCKKLRMRVNSPKVKVVANQRIKQRKGTTATATLSESFAVIKNSSDPKKDFRESMLEMIREKELKGSKDLEELLACYLCLNSSDYHDVIVKVFEEIWFDVNEIK